MSTITLWRPAYDGSPPTWRVQLTLAEKGLSWSEHRVSFPDKPAALLAANPRGQTPTLLDGDAAIFETSAILHYIEDIYPSPALMPADAMLRATALSRVEEVSNHLSTAFLGYWRYRSATPPDRLDPEQVSHFVEALKEEWQRWEDYLDDADEPYFIGDRLSLVDLSVFPYLANSLRNGLAVEARYPRLNAFFQHMMRRPSVTRTWPPSWLERPADTTFA